MKKNDRIKNTISKILLKILNWLNNNRLIIHV